MTRKKFETVKQLHESQNWVLNLNTYLESLKAEAEMNFDFEMAKEIKEYKNKQATKKAI